MNRKSSVIASPLLALYRSLLLLMRAACNVLSKVVVKHRNVFYLFELLSLLSLLQGEWTLYKRVHFGKVTDLEPFFAMGVETDWPKIGFLGECYYEGDGRVNYSKATSSGGRFTVMKKGDDKYFIDVFPFKDPKGVVCRGVLVIRGDRLYLSLAQNGFRPKDADPKADDGDEVRCYK